MHDPALSPDTLERAEAVYGLETSNGIRTILAEKFDPRLAEFVLRWLLSRNQQFAPPAGTSSGILDGKLLRSWVSDILTQYEEEIWAFVREETEKFFREGVKLLASNL